MDTLLWWTLLIILIISIFLLSFYFFCNLFQVYCNASETSVNNNHNIKSQSQNLNKHRTKLTETDVEDLTNIDKDLSQLLPKVQLVNEVEGPKRYKKETYYPSEPSTPRGSYRRRPSLLLFIQENSVDSVYSVQDIMDDLKRERGGRRGSEFSPLARKYSVVTEGMRRNSLATLPRTYSLMPDRFNMTSTDTLDYLDPIAIETKRAIFDIEEEARKIEYEIDYFIGTRKNLKFYEINEKLIRCDMRLSDIECVGEEVRKRKREVQGYIGECKEKLNSKVKE